MSDALAQLREPLEGLGLRRRAGQVYTVDLADGVIGWLGLNKASKHRQPGQIEVNPVVGVRHQQIERLVADLLGEKFSAYQPPTVSTPIGYALPESRYTSWVLGAGADPGVVDDLLAALVEYGLPFMRSLTGLAELRDALDRRLGSQPEYRLPVVVALMGDPERAAGMVARTVAELGSRQDAAAERFRRFAEAFGGAFPR